MYKTRLRKWDIAKNVKTSDLMNALAQNRILKTTTTTSSSNHKKRAAAAASSSSIDHHEQQQQATIPHPDNTTTTNTYPSSFTNLQGQQQKQPPELLKVGHRLIRSDRVQQAIQRRAAEARRAMMKNHGQFYPPPLWPQGWDGHSHSSPHHHHYERRGTIRNFDPGAGLMFLAPTAMYYQPHDPESFRVPERILQNSHAFIQGLFENSQQPPPPPPHHHHHHHHHIQPQQQKRILPPTPSALIPLKGPVQHFRLLFEETINSLLTMPTPRLTRLALQNLDDAFASIRACLTANDPQFVLVLTQLLSLCLWSGHPEILGMLVRYLRELTKVVLGLQHPLSQICRELSSLLLVASTSTTAPGVGKGKRMHGLNDSTKIINNMFDGGGGGGGGGNVDATISPSTPGIVSYHDRGERHAMATQQEKEMMARVTEICKVVSEACWRQFSAQYTTHGHALDDTFVHLTSVYTDVLDSLGFANENEALLRYVVDDMMSSSSSSPGKEEEGEEDLQAEQPGRPRTGTQMQVPVIRRISMEMHLILALRRREKYTEAIQRLNRVRDELSMLSPENTTVQELTYEVIRINGLCELGRGNTHQGRQLLWEAFDFTQVTKGKYASRTTRALREVVRWGEPDDPMVLELTRDLEERLGRVSLEGENAA